jgi:hypothetical protein
MVSIPLANLYHVNKHLSLLIFTKGRIEPGDRQVCVLIGHQINQD